MLIRFIQSFSKSCYKLMVQYMVQYAFRDMSADFGKARSQVQLMARSLNVGIAVFEMPYLRNVRIRVSRPVDGTVVIIERLDEHTHTYDIEKSFRIKNQVYCGTISKLKQPKIIPQPKYTMQSEVQVHIGSERLGELGGSPLKR